MTVKKLIEESNRVIEQLKIFDELTDKQVDRALSLRQKLLERLDVAIDSLQSTSKTDLKTVKERLESVIPEETSELDDVDNDSNRYYENRFGLFNHSNSFVKDSVADIDGNELDFSTLNF